MTDSLRTEMYLTIFKEYDFYQRIQTNSKKLILDIALQYDNLHTNNPLYKQEYREFEKILLPSFFSKFSNVIAFDAKSNKLALKDETTLKNYANKDMVAIIETLATNYLITNK